MCFVLVKAHTHTHTERERERENNKSFIPSSPPSLPFSSKLKQEYKPLTSIHAMQSTVELCLSFSWSFLVLFVCFFSLFFPSFLPSFFLPNRITRDTKLLSKTELQQELSSRSVSFSCSDSKQTLLLLLESHLEKVCFACSLDCFFWFQTTRSYLYRKNEATEKKKSKTREENQDP